MKAESQEFMSFLLGISHTQSKKICQNSGKRAVLLTTGRQGYDTSRSGPMEGINPSFDLS
jgi:hypothetical protein